MIYYIYVEDFSKIQRDEIVTLSLSPPYTAQMTRLIITPLKS